MDNTILNWRIDDDILDGYPFCYYKEPEPPFHPPHFESISLNHSIGYVGIPGVLVITITAFKYILAGDVIVIDIKNSVNISLLRDNVVLDRDGQINSVSYSIADDFIQTLAAGEYTVSAALIRDSDEYITASCLYLVHALPEVSVISLLPDTIQKPISVANNELTPAYEITGVNIKQIENTFKIAGFSVSEMLKSSELMKIESTTKTTSLYNVSFAFTVTDPEYKLISFKFLFGDYNASTEVDYRIDSVSVQKGNYPMNGWVEYAPAIPRALAVGSHTIQVYNSPSYWYLFSTTVKPIASGMTITSSTLYAMEMVYSISTSGLGGEHVVKIALDDSIVPGLHPVIIDSEADLDGYGLLTFNTTSDVMLEVQEAPAPDPDIGGVTASKTGRYVGCETDIDVNASGLEYILTGDVLTIQLKSGETVKYTHAIPLVEGASSHNHTVPANAFSGLAVGEYTVTTSISRDSFSKSVQTSYRVIAKPVITFAGITPDKVQLPITGTLNVKHTWPVNGEGINSITGTVNIKGTTHSCNASTLLSNPDLYFTLTSANAPAAPVVSLVISVSVVSNNYGTVTINDEYADVFEILEAIPDPDIGSITLSKPGRYTGCEIDIEANVTGSDRILAGDTLKICLKSGSSVIYEYTAALTQGSVSYNRTIPASVFIGLAVGEYSVTATVLRDEFSKEVQTLYNVAARPTVGFISITPDVVQLPPETPLTVSTEWLASGVGIDNIQGTINIEGTNISFGVDTSGLSFNAVFSNIAALSAGLYSLAASLTVTSNNYGSVSISDTHSGVFQAIEPLPDPVIGGLSLSVPGRYINSECDVTVNVSGLQDVLTGDIIYIWLYRQNTVIYEHSQGLSADASAYSHIIPQANFIGLDTGAYSIKAVIKRGLITSNETESEYKAVSLPTVSFVSITPDKIQLPILSPLPIDIFFSLSSEGVNEITGTASFDDTGYSAGISASGLNLSVSLTNISGLEARGYFISVNLTVTSYLYGTAVISRTFDNVLRVLDIITPRDIASGVIYLYKGLDLVAILRNYISFKWVRRYNKSGEFILQLENTPDNIDLIHSGNIVAKDEDDEAGFIEDITITDKIEVKGAFLSKMLGFRIVNYSGESPVDFMNTVKQLVNQNFVNAGASRTIPGFRITDYNIAVRNVIARLENGTILKWLEEQDAGFKIRFNAAERKYDFVMYDGKQSSAVFCENFRNISEQQYYEQNANYKNVCYVEGTEQVHEIGNAQGLERRETYIKAGKYDPVEYGNQYLKQNKKIKALDVKIINPYSPFEYKTDYDVGDIVTVASEDYKVEISKNILEITEFWDKTGFHLYVVFGDIPRDLLTELQDKDTRLEALENMPVTDVNPEEIEEFLDEQLAGLLDLVIPDIVDEVYGRIVLDPLPDYLIEDALKGTIAEISREVAEEVIDEKIAELTALIGAGGHIVIDSMPGRPELDSYENGSIILVKDLNNVYDP